MPAGGVGYRLVRRALGINAFGVNAFTADEGVQLIEEHDEVGVNAGRHEELYVVLTGRARFTIDGAEHDATAGTLVFIPDPESRRSAVALEDGTSALAVGGAAGEPYEVSPWEPTFAAKGLADAGDPEGAADLMAARPPRRPGKPGVLYNLACFEALAGRREAALEHLRAAARSSPTRCEAGPPTTATSTRCATTPASRARSLRPMARRRLEGLERVLGANALFSTAYGNVGSSIYYALGLVASFALGLTPIVFIITGFFFFCTAATYAEATTMYPEAGGSSSFARRAFNEFWSFVAAWAQMLTYIATIAISAFFVPHYIGGLFWEPLRSSPGDIIAGCCVIAVLAAINVFGAKESTGVNILLAVIDFATQLLLVLVGFFLVFSPEVLVDNVTLGVAPEWKDFVLAIPIGMLAYTGIETISNMSEEARDEAKTIPTAINRVRIAVFAIYFTLPAVALSALPVTFNRADRRVLDAAGPDRGGGRLRRRPDPRRRQGDRPRAAAVDRRDLRRPAGGHDPLPGHQRGHHRRVAARLLDGHPPPAARRAAQPAPALPHAVGRHPRLLGLRDPRRSCRARRSSSARSTRSAPCCRSRWPTRR